jgi:hypothetical protein
MAFCVGPRHLVTCAHVVAEALGSTEVQFARDPPPADSQVKLHFFGTRSDGARAEATVTAWWRNIKADDHSTAEERRKADIALLELDEAAIAKLAQPQFEVRMEPGRLLTIEEMRPDLAFFVRGSVKGGVLAGARIKQELWGRWTAIQENGEPIQPGFSGGGALTIREAETAVLGMVVRANERVEQSELIASPVLREVLSPFVPLVGVPPAAETAHIITAVIGRLPQKTPLLGEAFRAALAGIDPPPDIPAIPAEIVEAVADLPPDQNGHSRLDRFAAELALRLTGAAEATALRPWLERDDRLVEPPPKPEPVVSQPVHGVIEIRRGCPPGFVARAWLCSEGDSLGFEPTEAGNRKELENWVAATVLAFARESQARKRELALEFLLADELLFTPEAQAELFPLDPSRPNSQLLGTVYPVVLRSHWRAANEMAAHFRPNWEQWCDMAIAKGCSPVRILTSAPSPRTLFSQLAAQLAAKKAAKATSAQQGNAQEPDFPMTVVLAFPPKSARSRAALDDVLQAGAPIVCWVRQAPAGLSEEDLKCELTHLAGGDFHGLPQRLRLRRQEIAGNAEPERRVSSRDISVIYDVEKRSLDRLVRAAQLRGDRLRNAPAGS